MLAFPAALFLLALATTYRSSGAWRTVATAVMLAAVAGAIGILLDPVSGIALVAGPLMATLAMRRPPRVVLDFEALSRRAIAIAGAVIAAIFAASKFPVAENTLVLTSVLWMLPAVGAAWMVRSLDPEERIQGLVFLIAGGAALVAVAIPSGPVGAGLAGLMALLPVVARRWPLPNRLVGIFAPILIGASAVCALVAVSPVSLPSARLGDLRVAFDGPVLVGVATLLLAAVLVAASRLGWALLPGIASLLVTAPAVRWAGLAALLAVLTVDDPAGERPAWLAIALLGISPLFSALVLQTWSSRAASVLAGCALVVVAVACRRMPWGGLLLAATTFAVVLAMRTMPASAVTRLQWIAAAGAVLLTARPLLLRGLGAAVDRDRLRESLLAALLLLAVGSRDPLGLGILAAVLLILDLTVVLPWPVAAMTGTTDWFQRLDLLARSTWPPGITFAAGVLTVTAALQASLALGLFAAVVLACLQLAPFLDPPVALSSDRRRMIDWLAPAISLACGLAPALVLRMLRV